MNHVLPTNGSVSRGLPRSLRRLGHATRVTLVVALAATPMAFVRGDDVLQSGVSMVPADAAFLTATLRIREQIDRVLASNAFAAVKRLPAVQRALDAIEEQKIQPGSPLSMAATFLELPENKQAVAVLADMVSTDTFLYGEPSCIVFLELLQKVQRAQQAAGFLELGRASPLDGARAQAAGTTVPVRFQVAEVEDEQLTRLQMRLALQTLVDNVESIVIPDLVWGFRTTQLPAAEVQMKRIDGLLKLVTQGNPDLAQLIGRKKVAGGELITITVDGGLVPWGALTGSIDDLDVDGFEAVIERLQSLDVVVALGVIGDRVILSIGDAVDHLDKLGKPGDARGLASVPALQPLREHRSRAITGISYVSEALNKLLVGTTADIDQLAELSGRIAESAGLSDEAAAEARSGLEKMSAALRRRLPVAGAWMSYAFLTDSGYEGYAWDWSKNLPLDGSRRLDLSSHTGGAPLAALITRSKNDAEQFDDVVSMAGMAMSFFRRNILPQFDDEPREMIELADKNFRPVVDKITEILRQKIIPATADGQFALVIDGKSKTKRLSSQVPGSVEPLPLVEPAIAVRLSNPALFREGLSDLFALGDEVVDKIRELQPDSVPPGYLIPEPEKTKVPGGNLWTFALPAGLIDEQIRPAIGVGEDAAVFSLVPKQAARMLAANTLETGAQLSKFEEPLAQAAALDVAGLIDLVEPWVVYAARVASVQQREGSVDPDRELSADDEEEQVRDVLGQVKVVLEALRSIRVAVAETSITPEASVTHWRNVIRDMPKE
ncbi:MAG: hypothetical protein ACKOCW_12010 [Planctomycetaceae bacterium]